MARRKARTRSVIKPIHSLDDDPVDAVGICQDIVVSKAQYAKFLRSQVCIARLIGSRLPVLSAIRLNDQARFKARKVDNVVVDWNLPAEPQAFDLPLPQ